MWQEYLLGLIYMTLIQDTAFTGGIIENIIDMRFLYYYRILVLMLKQYLQQDVHENRAQYFFDIENIKYMIALVQNREYDLGQYIFVKAKNVREENIKKPGWLYRSYPSHLLEDR